MGAAAGRLEKVGTQCEQRRQHRAQTERRLRQGGIFTPQIFVRRRYAERPAYIGDVDGLLLRPFRSRAGGAGPVGELAAIQEDDLVIVKALPEERGEPRSAKRGGHEAAERPVRVCGNVDHETPASRKLEIDVARQGWSTRLDGCVDRAHSLGIRAEAQADGTSL